MSVTLEAEAVNAGQPVETAEAEKTQTSTGQQESVPTKRTYERIKSRWASVDALEVAGLPFEERRRYAVASLNDANFCYALRHHPITLRMAEYPAFYRKSLNTEVDLRLGALFIAPELMSDETVDNLVQVGAELSQQLGPGRERDFDDIDKLSKLHDIMALEALWMARGAVVAQEKVAAKVMLGDLTADAMREIVSLAKRMERSEPYLNARALRRSGGILAEFMLVTWERLNLYMASHGDINVLARVFVRSSTGYEDDHASSKDRSIDAVIMNLDRDYIRPQQHKSGASDREYDKAIDVVHIPDWALVKDNIQDVAKQFDIILSPHSLGSAKEKAREALNEYFERPRVTKVTK